MKSLLIICVLIAQSIAFAQSHTYEKCVSDDVVLHITSQGITRSNGTLISSLSNYKKTASIEATLHPEIQVWRETTYYVDGDLISGDGSSSNWNGFFNVKKSQKSRALQTLVKGIGKSTAKILVDKNAFQNKPKSWQAFLNILRSYETQHSELQGVVSNVTSYSTENQIALGYAIRGPKKRKTKTEKIRTFTKEEIVDITFKVDRVLLDGESEKVTVQSGYCKRSDLTVYTHGENYYDISADTHYRSVEIYANRKRVAFPRSSFNYTPVEENGSLVLKNLYLIKNATLIKNDLEKTGGNIKFFGSVECLSEKGSFWAGRSKEDKAKDASSKKVIKFFNLSEVSNGEYATGVTTGCDFKTIVKLKATINGSTYYKNSTTYENKKTIQLK